MSRKNFFERWNNDSVTIYFIEVANEIVGYLLITKRNEIGYFILPEHQGKKYATKAIKKLMRKENRCYYWALIDFDNEKSINFIQSLGFTPRSLVYTKQKT